jgi:hypothetical protein
MRYGFELYKKTGRSRCADGLGITLGRLEFYPLEDSVRRWNVRVWIRAYLQKEDAHVLFAHADSSYFRGTLGLISGTAAPSTARWARARSDWMSQ